MDKNLFFSNSLIKSFLNDLSKNLISLPFELREQHISEIESDLYANAIELSKQGKKDEDIPQEVLKDYLSPKSIATAIQSEYSEEIKTAHPTNKTTIQSYTAFSIGPLGALSIPILFGNINISSSLPFIICFIVSNLVFIYNNNKIIWDDKMLTYLKKMIIVCRTVLLSLSLAFFSIRTIIKNDIDKFSLYYLLCYILISLIYIMLLKSLLKKKQA
ncbi:MAG: hypothetical protein ABF649_03255 [Bacillus sp. (in: firmicutes)]